jgi:Calcium-binding EGF domain
MQSLAPGSSTTTCSKGFHYDDILKRCEDTDECKLDNICKSTKQTCVNTPGGFTCVDKKLVCQSGYTNLDGKCIGKSLTLEDNKTGLKSQISHHFPISDINECSLSRHGCSHYCENTIGSYKCKCPANHYLDKTEKKCLTNERQNDENPRKTTEKPLVNHLRTSSMLVCPEGYEISDGQCKG